MAVFSALAGAAPVGAMVVGAVLKGAVGAMFVGAMLVGAMLVGAMLVGAMLVGAWLVGSEAGGIVIGVGVSTIVSPTTRTSIFCIAPTAAPVTGPGVGQLHPADPCGRQPCGPQPCGPQPCVLQMPLPITLPQG